MLLNKKRNQFRFFFIIKTKNRHPFSSFEFFEISYRDEYNNNNFDDITFFLLISEKNEEKKKESHLLMTCGRKERQPNLFKLLFIDEIL